MTAAYLNKFGWPQFMDVSGLHIGENHSLLSPAEKLKMIPLDAELRKKLAKVCSGIV